MYTCGGGNTTTNTKAGTPQHQHLGGNSGCLTVACFSHLPLRERAVLLFSLRNSPWPPHTEASMTQGTTQDLATLREAKRFERDTARRRVLDAFCAGDDWELVAQYNAAF
ncbi:hypothetical protein FI667_g17515, partial [Globisporangium splendens]